MVAGPPLDVQMKLNMGVEASSVVRGLYSRVPVISGAPIAGRKEEGVYT